MSAPRRSLPGLDCRRSRSSNGVLQACGFRSGSGRRWPAPAAMPATAWPARCDRLTASPVAYPDRPGVAAGRLCARNPAGRAPCDRSGSALIIAHQPCSRCSPNFGHGPQASAPASGAFAPPAQGRPLFARGARSGAELQLDPRSKSLMRDVVPPAAARMQLTRPGGGGPCWKSGSPPTAAASATAAAALTSDALEADCAPSPTG